MAIIDESGIKRDGDASAPLERHSQPSRYISSNSGSLPRTSNLSNVNRLKNSNEVAKPNSTKDEINPIKQSNQRRKSNGLFSRPNRRNKNNQNENGEDNPKEGEDSPQDTNKEEKEKGNGLLKNPLNRDNKNNTTGEDEEKSEGQELGEKLALRIKQFLMRHPVVILYALLALAILAILYIVISAVVAILTGGAALKVGIDEQQKNYGDFFAFDRTEIYLLDENGTKPIGSRTLTLSEYVKGIIYADTMNIDVSRLNDEQLVNYYAAIIVTKKAEVLKKGNYSNKTKSISLKITDFNYCDETYGCKLVSNSGKRLYLANSIDYKVDKVISSYEAMDSKKQTLLNQAYSLTLSKIVTPSSVKEPLTEYKWQAPSLSTSIYNNWVNNASHGTSYENLVKGSFPNYKVYNLDDYALQFESTYYASYSYWWPIGSSNPDSEGLYSGDPTSTSVTSKYGPSFATGTINEGIKISGDCGSTKVIAIADGTVTHVGENKKYGKYVVVTHDNNIQSLYGSLSSTSVSSGTSVVAGKLIGTVGKTKEGTCELYFEMYKNGSTVNPLDYISEENTRLSVAKYIKFVQGSDNKQTVCKTFLASGFSKNATAGLMANIERESGFRLNALSDGGTSNGLFQWHKGRLDRLKQYCGNEYLTSIKCQLDFFFYEITEGTEKNDGAYNYLMGNHSAYDMGYQFCMLFERPSGGAASATVRGNLAQSTYLQYVNNGCQ